MDVVGGLADLEGMKPGFAVERTPPLVIRLWIFGCCLAGEFEKDMPDW